MRMTRVELGLVASALLILAAIMIPVTAHELLRAEIAIAVTDLDSLAAAMNRSLVLAGDAAPAPPWTWLGPGPPPEGIGNGTGGVGKLQNLWPPKPGGPRTFLKVLPQDPWGHAYVALFSGVTQPAVCWLVSAGPDGILQTSASSPTTQGDDLGLRVR